MPREFHQRSVYMTAARRTLALIAAGVLLVLLLAVAFRAVLLGPIIVRGVHRMLGLHATIAAVEGSAVAGLSLKGVSARGEAGVGPLVSFAAERISARYSLMALLRGTAAFVDSLDVTVEGARLDLDLTRPAGEPPGRPSLPPLPRLTVRDSRVQILGQAFTLLAEGLQGTVARADESQGQAVELRADRFSLRHPVLKEGALSLAIAGRYSPRRLTIAAAQVNGEPLVERASLDLGERPGDLDLQLALRLWRGSAEVGTIWRAAGTEVSWDARGVDLQPQALLVNPALGALRGRLSTKGVVKLDGGGISTLTGRVSLDWQGALLAGRAVDRLVLEGSAEPGIVLVERAEGRIGLNEIRVGQARLPSGPLFEGRWRDLLAAASGSVAASLGDIPAFLAFWGIRGREGAPAVPEHRLRLEGTLEKGTVRLARGELATGLGMASLAGVTVSLPREDQGWGETAFSGAADVDIPNLRDLSALFPVPPLSGSLKGRVSGAGTLARPEGDASLVGRGIGVAGRMLGDAELQARGADGRIEVDRLQVRQGGNRLAAQDVRFSPAALAAGDRGAFLDSLAGSFDLRSTDVPALAALAGVPAEQVARTPATHLLSAAGTIRGRAIDLTAGSFAAAGGTITLRAARVNLPPPGSDWRKDTAFEGDLEADIPDLGPIAEILRLPPLQGALRGRVRVEGSPGAPTGSMEAAGRGIAIGGHRVGDVAVKASARSQMLRIEALEVSRGEDRLRGRGSYDLDRRTVLEAEADVSLADVAPYLREFAGEDIPVSGRFFGVARTTGPLPGTPLAIELEFSEGRIKDVQGVRCVAAAQVGFQGTLRQPRVSVSARVTELRGGPEGRTAQASFEATYEPGQLRIAALNLVGSRGITVKGEGAIPLDFAADQIMSAGPISLRAEASIPALEDLTFLVPPSYALAGALSGDLAVSGTWKQPEARLAIRGDRLRLPPGTRFAPPGPLALSGTIAWGAAEARVEKVRLEAPALSCSLSGAWSSPPSLKALASRQAGAATGALSLRASFNASDIGWLRESVEGLRGLRGGVSGEIDVEGPADDPKLSGEVRVADAAFRYRDLPAVDRISARVSVAGRTVNLGEVRGEVGGSPFALSGSLDLSRLDEPVLDLRLKGANALLYHAEGLRVRADSDLTLRGPVGALALAGEVALTHSRYERSFSVVSLLSGGGASSKPAKRPTSGFAGISFPDPPLKDMRFDVRLSARRPFRILTNAVHGAARPDLRLTGTGLLPILRGPIHFEDIQVALPSGTMEFERGTVIFGGSDPGRPVLDFGGRMETMGYEITAQIGGTLQDPEVILSSIPPLPKEDLLLFVLTGAPPSGAGWGGGSATAMATPMAVYLGKNVLENLLGAGPRSAGAELQRRLELQVGRELTRSGSVTMEARLLLKKNPVARGSALYLTGEKDVYDQENLGLRVVFKFR
jgi:hypothetical protein